VRTRRVISDVVTEDVSASGLRMRADEPHGLKVGDRCEIQLFARVMAQNSEDTLVMATDALVVRSDDTSASLRFEAPLVY
jgi:hypothetical protein